MRSLHKGKALKEQGTGLYLVDQPLVLLEVEEEADQVGLEVGLTLKPGKPVSRKVRQVTDEDLEDESEEISDEEDDEDEEDNISINALRATDFETGF